MSRQDHVVMLTDTERARLLTMITYGTVSAQWRVGRNVVGESNKAEGKMFAKVFLMLLIVVSAIIPTAATVAKKTTSSQWRIGRLR